MVNVDQFAAYRHAPHGRVGEEFTEAMVILNQLHKSALKMTKFGIVFDAFLATRK